MEDKKLFELAKKFKVSGEPTDIKLIDSGHINKTYKVIFEEENKKDTYILQYVNTNVFPNLPELMNNIKKVTNYIKHKATESNDDPSRITITMKDTVDENPYSICENNWRMEDFIDNTTTYLSTEDLNILYEAGTVAGIEQGPTWNLIPQHDANPVTLARKEYLDAYSNPLTGLVSTSINNSKAIQKSIKSTEEKVHYLTTSLNESKKLNKELATSLEKRTLENQKILENLKLMKQYIEKLEQNIDD
jgi:hypothetical protein